MLYVFLFRLFLCTYWYFSLLTVKVKQIVSVSQSNYSQFFPLKIYILLNLPYSLGEGSGPASEHPLAGPAAGQPAGQLGAGLQAQDYHNNHYSRYKDATR